MSPRLRSDSHKDGGVDPDFGGWECSICGMTWDGPDEAACPRCAAREELAKLVRSATTSAALRDVSTRIASCIALGYLDTAHAKAILFAIQTAVSACRIAENEGWGQTLLPPVIASTQAEESTPTVAASEVTTADRSKQRGQEKRAERTGKAVPRGQK